MSVLVTNLPNTGDEKCGCDSWIRHWERFTGREARRCVAKGCLKAAENGAHVKVVGYKDDSPYIVPLCDEHNQDKGQFELIDIPTGGKLLAPAE